MGKKYTHFVKTDRLAISILLKKGFSLREIAGEIGKSHSSLSREIKRNSVKGQYHPFKANHKARTKRRYSKYQGMKIVKNNDLRRYIDSRLKDFWTPESIAGRLKLKNDGKTVVSFKSIYKYLYSVHGQTLCNYLPHRRIKPKPRRKKKKDGRGQIKNRVSIRLRPEIVDKRGRFGDFEGDTAGKPKFMPQTLSVLVERQSLFLLVKKVQKLKYAVDGFKEMLNPYQNIVRSVTLDNGFENHRHGELNTNVFFCDPYCSWQKGLVENTIGRLRRFIPKKYNLKNLSNSRLTAIVNLMNNTPRKRLNYATPAEIFKEQRIKVTNDNTF